ncbi:MAG: 4-hydroxyphenylacetate 3-monooxygenase [Rhodospirillaceae bacterium]|nr:4-hydroxyphenylacetate 3-monooxygenase [Rhodospirillaceae bacterium]|tara:strand:+ start:803 stop:2281 length:1479 start_codon:yes stop_codon:yes gene_type:complete
MTKTGETHIEALRDGRNVILKGENVSDVTTHASYRNSVATSALLYDFQAAPENVEALTYISPDSGERVSRCWQLCESYEELRARRAALESWAECHFGFLGRSPDHVASGLAGQIMGIEVFERWNSSRAGALKDYYRYARDKDLYLSYVIINPQADRSKGAGEQDDPYLTARIVDEDAEGITVRGAKMLGTSCIMSNEVWVTTIQPLKEEEGVYALSFAIPMNQKGLKILSRKSYEEAAVSEFDNPLSCRFDENDAVLYFDDVKVPWERVFIAGDVEMCGAQFHGTPSHVHQNYQCQIRLNVKMRFLTGLAHKIAEANGVISIPSVREMLGQMAADAALVDSMLNAMEVKGRHWGPYYVVDRHTLYAAQVQTQQLYPRFISALRELAGGGMIMLPSSAEDFANPQVADYIHRTQGSPVFTPEERVKFFKLAWDAVGSEFASRHLQYEMFYAGASFVTKSHSYRTYDWGEAADLFGRMFDSYSLVDSLGGANDA